MLPDADTDKRFDSRHTDRDGGFGLSQTIFTLIKAIADLAVSRSLHFDRRALARIGNPTKVAVFEQLGELCKSDRGAGAALVCVRQGVQGGIAPAPMNQLVGLLTLIALPLSLLLNGYWLAALLERESPIGRLSVGLCAGLAVLVVGLGTLGYFHPIAGPWLIVCFTPAILTLLVPGTRAALAHDVLQTVSHGSPVFWIVGVAFVTVLLWPLLVSPDIVYFDGTSNHDAFFWIARAEFLLRHNYMEPPVMSATHPFDSTGLAIVGWTPQNGRISAEGMLAMAASITGEAPLRLYLYVSASLAFVWFAAVLLALRTFVSDKTSILTGAVLVGLQPIFVYFHGNANLPNLLGVLTGTTMVVAVERALRIGTVDRYEFAAWAAVAGISLSGMLSSYPEIAPFTLLPCGLLLARSWLVRRPGVSRRTSVIVASVLLAGAALNPAITIRAFNGFLASFVLARANVNWFDFFSVLDPAEYVPAIVTLSFIWAKGLGLIKGGAISLLIVAVTGQVLMRSRDRFGVLAALSGFVILVCYTMATGFSYGLQKSVQFSGVFIAVLFPLASVAVLARPRTRSNFRLVINRSALLGVIAITGYASVTSYLEQYENSRRKVLSQDWYELHEASRSTLADAPVLVEAASFHMDFFYGMWSAYFLSNSRLYFGARGELTGGYLVKDIISEKDHKIPTPAAILVGRDWADAFDSNSSRILSGREYALLEKSNRVIKMSGVSPLTGVPEHAGSRILFDIDPHSPSILIFELESHDGTPPDADWQVHRQAANQPDFTTSVTGHERWLIKIPLIAGVRNRVSIALAHVDTNPGTFPFELRDLRIEDAR